MKAFVYCAFGNIRYKLESIYSIITLQNSLGMDYQEYKIIVVTDDMNTYKEIENIPNIVIEEIDVQTVKEWSLEYTYYPRCKIKCLEYCFNKYKCNLLFIDTDTLVLKDVAFVFDNIKNGDFYMHSACTSVNKAIDIIADKTFREVNYLTLQRIHFYRYIYEKNFLFNRRNKIDANFVPYNSGIIGMDYNNRNLLNTILEISDLILQHFQYQCAEEFAFTYVLQNAGTIHKLENYVFHYPEAKFARYLAGSILNFFVGNDIYEAKNTFLKYGLNKINEMNLSLDDIPFFVRMLLAYSNEATKDLKLSSLDEVFTYLDKESGYYKEHNSIKKFKYYYKRMKLTQ